MYPYPDDPNQPGQQAVPQSMFQPQPMGPNMQPPQDGMQRAMNSPGAMMAMSALQNIASGQSHQPRTQNPIQQYQAAVAYQANNRLEQQKLMRELDPFWEFEEAKRRGLIPSEMDYFTYKDRTRTAGASDKPFAPMVVSGPDGTTQKLALPKYNQATGKFEIKYEDLPEGYVKAAPISYQDTGQTIYGMGPAGTPVTALPKTYDPNQSPELKAQQEAATQGAQSDATQYTTAIDTTWANRDAYDMAQQFYDVSENTLKMLESGKLDTGPINAFMLNVFGKGTEELAAMNAEQVQAVLENLQITNLAPVSEQELKTVAGLWADIARQKAPNIGVLKRVQARTKRLMDKLAADTKTQAERVRRYGGEEEWKTLLDTNPFVGKQYPEYDPEL